MYDKIHYKLKKKNDMSLEVILSVVLRVLVKF